MALAPVPPDSGATRREFDLRDLVSRAWSERVRILAVSLAAGLLALGISFLFPKWYRASATILPPEDTDLFTNISLAQRALTKFPAFGVLGDYFTPADVFKAVLKSRSIQDALINRFDLMKVYKLKSREKALKALKSHYDVKLSPDGTITVSVEDKDPKRAASLATGLLEELDKFNINNRNTSARRTRLFLEQRVHETDSLLRVMETTMKLYQEERHTVVPITINSSDMSSSADLMARKIALEVRLGVLRTYLRPEAEEIRAAATELQSLESRIATLPAMQSDIGRMVRDQKIQEQVFALLTAELEQARIRETMNTPTVQILDPAVPPERHARPKRATIAVAVLLATMFATGLYFGFKEPRRA